MADSQIVRLNQATVAERQRESAERVLEGVRADVAAVREGLATLEAERDTALAQVAEVESQLQVYRAQECARIGAR